ncbi:hypothetical protein EYF80_058671 [Liparis tanakae]|uniref:UPAR/Ly6 domain-containing protein n=1 Tax=Liparis tanakae TaxID=230148 RepID=A0A4Z2EQG0_9TELE|nr:hypothetical protein EYF80_058671 [Liparis tanakae]
MRSDYDPMNTLDNSIRSVEPLSCYTCDVGFLGFCCHKTPVNCTATEDKCYSAVAKFSAVEFEMHESGCTEESGCGDSHGHVLNVNYTITKTCCSNSLCNGAASTQLPLTLTSYALGAALVAVWSHWGL